MDGFARWSVTRVCADAQSADLLHGYDLDNRCGRVSTAVFGLEPGTGRVWTQSGRAYVLDGPPGDDPDGQYVFRAQISRLPSPQLTDVTEVYAADIALARKAAGEGAN
jgi:hypothetical protein